ncbi:MAG: hypothetical protein ACYDH9_12315 [Limisphaerales bacterium]
MTKHQPNSTVRRIHFEDFSGTDFERLVFAYMLRTNDWFSLDWYGQTGSDSGRDIWGIREDDKYPKGQRVCALCANWQKLTKKKAETDLAKLKSCPDGRPDKCIVIGGGVVSAELRDAIKAEASKAAINVCEVWSGPEFEERLRCKAESLLKRFVGGEAFPDSPKELRLFVGSVQVENDDERLALMSSLFDRPAFYTPFYQESSVPAFKKAITDTIEALGTGVHRLRDGTEIRRIPSRHQIQSPEIKRELGAIEKRLAKLRATYDSLVKTGEIRLCGCSDPECPTFQPSPSAIQQMDQIRTRILDSFRKVYPKFDVHLGLDCSA